MAYLDGINFGTDQISGADEIPLEFKNNSPEKLYELSRQKEFHILNLFYDFS